MTIPAKVGARESSQDVEEGVRTDFYCADVLVISLTLRCNGWELPSIRYDRRFMTLGMWSMRNLLSAATCRILLNDELEELP